MTWWSRSRTDRSPTRTARLTASRATRRRPTGRPRAMARRTPAGARWASGPENDLAERLVRGQPRMGVPDLIEREHRVDDGTHRAPFQPGQDLAREQPRGG